MGRTLILALQRDGASASGTVARSTNGMGVLWPQTFVQEAVLTSLRWLQCTGATAKGSAANNGGSKTRGDGLSGSSQMRV